ncbi:hypothetical protein GCM10007389_12440 [Pontibacter akesuensis]|nr:hypothetical protein GCM10007389_12440 [Pontibacter akesuensis]
MLGMVYTTQASGNNNVKSKATARANYLSDQMIKNLRLNNFQSEKIREINKQIAEEMTAIEQQYAGNQAIIDQLCKEACAQRDVYLEEVLSTVQYNKYFNSRPDYTNMDKQFMATMDAGNGENGATANAATDATPVAVN